MDCGVDVFPAGVIFLFGVWKMPGVYSKGAICVHFFRVFNWGIWASWG